MTDRIVTERLVLRLPVPEDWPAWQAFYASPRSSYVGGGSGATLVYRRPPAGGTGMSTACARTTSHRRSDP